GHIDPQQIEREDVRRSERRVQSSRSTTGSRSGRRRNRAGAHTRRSLDSSKMDVWRELPLARNSTITSERERWKQRRRSPFEMRRRTEGRHERVIVVSGRRDGAAEIDFLTI